MTNVQIREVPEPVLAALRRMAADRGQSLQRYLLALLSDQARIDSTARLLADAAEDSRANANASFDAVALVRAARADRETELGDRHSR